jgi:peptidoglycan/LPS O-acetylase OafA/YrhL
MQPRDARIDFVDYLRGIAILGVFAFHAWGATFGPDPLTWNGWIRSFPSSRSLLFLSPLNFGAYGVAIFFVVSGFCIQLSFVRSNQTGFGVFYVRRFFRIYPPYLAVLLFFAFLFPTTRMGFSKLWDWAQLGSHLLLIQNLDNRSFFAISPAFWTIAVEVQLYLLFPVLVAIVARFGWRSTLLFVGIIEVLLRAFLGIYATVTGLEPPLWWGGVPLMYWFSWSIGAALADAWQHERPLPFARSSPLFWVLLAIGANYVRPLAIFTFPLIAVSTATTMARFLAGAKVRLSVPRWLVGSLRRVGLWSYSIYLLHQPLVLAGRAVAKLLQDRHMPSVSIFLMYISLFVFILPISVCFYRYCELPSISLGKLILAKRRAADHMARTEARGG